MITQSTQNLSRSHSFQLRIFSLSLFSSIVISMTTPSVALAGEVTLVRVADFGAIPNDGLADAAALRAAVASVTGVPDVEIVFEAGVYNLKEAEILERSGRVAMLHVWGEKNWTLRGAVDDKGAPATTLEMNLELGNAITGASHLDIRNCQEVAVENFVFDQNPRFATAGKIVARNWSAQTVTFEAFEGMPHFDGMSSFSANNWDLETRLLIPGPAVTIGIDEATFSSWSKVPGYERRYSMQNSSMIRRVAVGQGLSFHFNVVAGDARCVDAYDSEDLRFENLFFYNVIGMVMGAGDNRNMTFKKVHVKPEGASLAVGPRDGLHITRSTGKLLMDDVVVKGVRWDPLVIYLRFVPISQRSGSDRIRLDGSEGVHSWVFSKAKAGPGSVFTFWSGAQASIGIVQEVQGDTIIFTAPLDPAVQAGTTLTPASWQWEEAIIRNSLIESNYGTGLVYQSDNLLVEHNIFRNNSYSNIGLGATSSGAGTFCRNIMIRNNLFEGSTWEEKFPGLSAAQRGTITLFNKHPDFSNEPRGISAVYLNA